MAAAERFSSLAVVRQDKPLIPEESLEEVQDQENQQRSKASSHLSPRARRISQRHAGHTGFGSASHTFQGLINQVIVQHCFEIQELQARLDAKGQKVKFMAKRTCSMESAGKEDEQDQLHVSHDTEPMEDLQEGSYASGNDSEVSGEWGFTKKRRISYQSAASPSTTALMMKNRENLREVQASDIINMLAEGDDDEEKPEAKQDFLHPVGNAIAKLTGQKSEGGVDSEFVEKVDYKTLSKFQRLQAFLQSNTFEMTITVFLLFNVLWMAFELQVHGSMNGHAIGFYKEPMVDEDSWPAVEQIISIGDLIFSALFALDVTIRLLVLGPRFFKVCMNYVDLGVTIASLFEIFIFAATPSGFINPVLFRLLRIGKLARALRMVTMSNVLASLQLLLKCLAASMDMLFWTFCLLTFLQCVAGMIVSTLARDFITDAEQPLDLRLEVFQYYGTFTRTFLSMFEILFANWAPPCRAVVEAISEWFSVFFLLYRCVLGFAVLNVVNAVFVQQTMKTASSDEDLAFKQKQKDAAVYTRKVKKLFQTMDASGDGAINLEEFAKLVKSPKLKFWMSQLELEYHDLLSLFEFLDNGDGQITLKEFIEGAARLRGGAKALDIWRLETKVEVLFDEILKTLTGPDDSITLTKSVQDVFAHSSYRHMQSAAKVRSENFNSTTPATPTPDGAD